MTSLSRQIVVRVDDDLYARLQQDAEANGRTVAQSVRFHLRDVGKPPPTWWTPTPSYFGWASPCEGCPPNCDSVACPARQVSCSVPLAMAIPDDRPGGSA